MKKMLVALAIALVPVTVSPAFASTVRPSKALALALPPLTISPALTPLREPTYHLVAAGRPVECIVYVFLGIVVCW
jgi:hypothetical protein